RSRAPVVARCARRHGSAGALRFRGDGRTCAAGSAHGGQQALVQTRKGELMIPMAKAKLLEGKQGLIAGIANENSIAWGCAKAFRALGAELAVTYLNDKAKK